MKMKKLLPLIVLFFITVNVFSQKTLVVEKIGTSRKFFYHTGDYLKLRVSKLDTLFKGTLWHIGDSVISVAGIRPLDVHISDIGSVYKQFAYPKKFCRYIAIGSIGIFTIIAFNHLINNEQVFTADMFIISGSMLGASLLSLSLSQKKCKIGLKWKIKILEINAN